MTMVLGLLALLVVIALYLLSRNKARAPTDEKWPIHARAVMSQAEQVMYHRLVRAFPEYVVLSQVAFSRFIGVNKGANFSAVFNRFNRLTADFVVCRKDFKATAVLELDDRSHDRPDRLAADVKKSLILKSAGIALHRLNVNPMLDEQQLRQLID